LISTPLMPSSAPSSGSSTFGMSRNTSFVIWLVPSTIDSGLFPQKRQKTSTYTMANLFHKILGCDLHPLSQSRLWFDCFQKPGPITYSNNWR
jgi:hypothetical protein